MPESKAELRRELERLVEAYTGEVHHDAGRVSLACPTCSSRRYVPMSHVRQFGFRCLRCRAAMRLG
jgi:hypothetical protein